VEKENGLFLGKIGKGFKYPDPNMEPKNKTLLVEQLISHWIDSDEAQCRELLLKTLELFRTIPPDPFYQPSTSYQSVPESYMTHFEQLLLVYKQLSCNQYKEACNEFQKLIHFSPCFQSRIRCAIILMLSYFLEETDDEKLCE